jgi:hypothetical protein
MATGTCVVLLKMKTNLHHRVGKGYAGPRSGQIRRANSLLGYIFWFSKSNAVHPILKKLSGGALYRDSHLRSALGFSSLHYYSSP